MFCDRLTIQHDDTLRFLVASRVSLVESDVLRERIIAHCILFICQSSRVYRLHKYARTVVVVGATETGRVVELADPEMR